MIHIISFLNSTRCKKEGRLAYMEGIMHSASLTSALCTWLLLAGGCIYGSSANPCSDVTCENGGICRDLNGYAQCYCPYGYEGDACQTVIPPDTSRPTISGCPDDFTVLYLTGTKVSWPVPLFRDDSAKLTVEGDLTGCKIFSPGETSITYTVTDDAGNEDTCEFTMTLVTSCADGTVCLNGGQCNEDGDVCICPTGYQGSICQFQDTTDLNPCQNGGTYNIPEEGCYNRYPCLDTNICNCVCPPGFWGVTCEFKIPIDGINPIVEGCPENIRISSFIGPVPVSWDEPTVFDNSGRFSVELTHEPGSTFSYYTTFVKYTVKDEVGNINDCCSFTVDVYETECSRTCENGGKCLTYPGEGQSHCSCEKGYSGFYCENERSDMCFTPGCAEGYTGTRCGTYEAPPRPTTYHLESTTNNVVCNARAPIVVILIVSLVTIAIPYF